MPFVGVNGIKLYYAVTGSRDLLSPAALFLHGLGSSAADWALQTPVFAERYRVITLDLRAHGQSRAADSQGRFTIEMMADAKGQENVTAYPPTPPRPHSDQLLPGRR